VAAIGGLLLPCIPVERLVALARRLSPSGAILPKTELLLQALRYTLPLLGALLAIWLAAPRRWTVSLGALLGRTLDRRGTVWAVIGLGLAVRLAWLLAYPTRPYADSQWYLDRATWLAQGYGYILDPASGIPTAAWPPGYPWLLSLLFRLTGPSQAVALALNVALGGLCVWLTVMLGVTVQTYTTASRRGDWYPN